MATTAAIEHFRKMMKSLSLSFSFLQSGPLTVRKYKRQQKKLGKNCWYTPTCQDNVDIYNRQIQLYKSIDFKKGEHLLVGGDPEVSE